jgi:hypothetical protein
MARSDVLDSPYDIKKFRGLQEAHIAGAETPN